jgi:hypothetical protein
LFVYRTDKTGYFSVGDKCRGFIRFQARIYHTDNRAEPVERQDRNRMFENIGQHRCDAITTGYTGCDETGRHSFGLDDQPGKRQLSVAAIIDNRRMIRRPRGGQPYVVPDSLQGVGLPSVFYRFAAV